MSGKVRYTVIFCGLILMASSALAGPDIQIGWGDYSQSPGGAFKVTVLNPVINGYAVGESFDTFCLEKKEHIAIGAKYWVSMDKVAVGGGSATGSDPLSGATAWQSTRTPRQAQCKRPFGRSKKRTIRPFWAAMP